MMRYPLAVLGIFAALAYAASAEVESQRIDDQEHGFSLVYPKAWRAWKDSDEKCHLTLRSTDDHMMVFVLSEVLDTDLQPKSEADLVDWGRRVFVHHDPDDPKVSAESITVTDSLFRKCVAVRLAMSTSEGKTLRSEVYAFTDYLNNRSHRRIWKVFAMYEPERVTPAELDGWQMIKASLKITLF